MVVVRFPFSVLPTWIFTPIYKYNYYLKSTIVILRVWTIIQLNSKNYKGIKWRRDIKYSAFRKLIVQTLGIITVYIKQDSYGMYKFGNLHIHIGKLRFIIEIQM